MLRPRWLTRQRGREIGRDRLLSGILSPGLLLSFVLLASFL